MHVAAEDEGLWSTCILTLGGSEEHRDSFSAKNALGEKYKLNSTWERARYVNSLTIQVSISSK